MELPPRNCPACGVANLATAIYCASCRSILPAIPVLPGVMGRVKKTSPFPSFLKSFLFIADVLIRRVVPFGVILALGMALWPVEIPLFSRNTPATYEELFPQRVPEGMRIFSDNTATQLLQKLLSGNPSVVCGEVHLHPGRMTVRFRLSYHGLPVSIGVTYGLIGEPGSWSLSPLYGRMGHLPIGGNAANFLIVKAIGEGSDFVALQRLFSGSRSMDLQEHSLRF